MSRYKWVWADQPGGERLFSVGVLDDGLELLADRGRVAPPLHRVHGALGAVLDIADAGEEGLVMGDGFAGRTAAEQQHETS